MFDFNGRMLNQAEHLGMATAFLPQIQAVLGRDSLFGRISEEESAYLADYMPCYRIPKGTLLIRDSEPGGSLIFVIAGRLEISKRDADAGTTCLARVGPGDTLGEMSLLDDKPRAADCVALEEVTFAVLERGVLDLLIRQNPGLVIKMLTQIILILSERLRHTSNALTETLQARH